MKVGTRMAVGIGVGYLLGRTHKMKLALALTGMGLSRQAGGPQALLQRGTSVLGSSTELTKLTDAIRGQLMDAARAAAVTAASNRIDALNERLQLQSTRSEDEDTDEDEYPEDADDHAEDDYESADENEEEEEDEEEDSEPERAKGKKSSSTRARQTTRRRAPASRSRTPAKASGSGERKPTGSRQRRTRADTADSAPVRRTKR
ncbi:hypothetical protein [Nocardia xishanensis]|uniref:hypothetical protein n=1 Tax=Nocardia xishanensis TaxID=238964 RepID=UPI00344504D8